ncbi:MAG: PilN domain-containing protein [Desulfobacterales bacterium]|nr:PilN domain-containing protein [Desulfobacterales bacterium]
MALREINLIPAEILNRQHLVRHFCFWTGCLVTSLALILGIYLYQSRAVLAEKQTLAKLEVKYDELGVKIQEINQIQKELQNLAEQQVVLSNITRTQPYSRVLVRLAQIMSEHTWLTQLVIEGGTDTDARPNLKLTGLSHSNKDLGEFVNRLSNEPLFKAVTLKYARETRKAVSRETESPLILIQFQIESHV